MLIEYDNVPRLRRVISGGQTGADQGGLFAARACGLETGGFAPLGFRTLAGNNAETLRDLFGLEETPQRNYQVRTALNVKSADATFRLATNFGSPGELCTMKAINRYDKPFMDVDLKLVHKRGDNEYIQEKVNETFQFLITHQVQILNIAGNADRFPADGYGEHFHRTIFFLMKLFQKAKSCDEREELFNKPVDNSGTALSTVPRNV